MSEPLVHGELAAAIDLGTNTALCLVGGRGGDGSLVVVEDRSRMPRLGAGLARRGTLAPEAVERTLELLSEYVRRLDELGVPAGRRRAVSTAVLRRAEDASEFVRAVRAKTGLVLEILAPEDEARLGHAAVAASSGADTIVLDVGGGSTEVVWDGGRSMASVPAGAVVLTDLHGDDVEGAIVAAREACTGLPEGVARDAAGSDPRCTVVAIGGTAVNLACLDQGLARFEAERAEGHVLGGATALRWARALTRLGLSERGRLPIEPGRADVLPAGLACLGVALERPGSGAARISMRGLRYGLLAEILDCEA